MMAIGQKIDVFAYRDYRRFLADVYQSRKESEYGFSYRAFAKKVGSTAPNYLKLVTQGERNLTAAMAARFAQALGLKGEAADYFCDLVAFNQARTVPERERYYQALLRYRRYKRVFRLDRAYAEYHGDWYIPALRELVACDDFRPDPKWIARRLQPNISSRQAERAMKILMKLGLVVVDESGKWRQHEPLLSTGDDGPLGHHIANYHRKMMDRAAAAIDLFPREKREVSSLTLNLTTAQLGELKKRLLSFRQELLQASLDSKGEPVEHVVQVNFQMFPLTSEVDGSEA
jgi:uncharacterized protein (TIGR02147 family)